MLLTTNYQFKKEMTTQVMPSFAGGVVWCPVDGAIIKPYSETASI